MLAHVTADRGRKLEFDFFRFTAFEEQSNVLSLRYTN